MPASANEASGSITATPVETDVVTDVVTEVTPDAGASPAAQAPVSDYDQILADLGGSVSAASEPVATEEIKTEETTETPTPTERKETVVPQPKAEDEGEVTPPVPEAVAYDPASDPESATSKWQARKAKIVDGWKEYDAPGERELVETVDELTSLVDELRNERRVEQARTQEQAALAEAGVILNSIETATQRLNAELGLKLEPHEVVGIMENGALKGYSLMNGVPIQSGYDVTPEIVEAAYKAKFPGQIAAKAAPAKPAPPREVGGGGGPRVVTQPKTERERIMADLAEGGLKG